MTFFKPKHLSVKDRERNMDLVFYLFLGFSFISVLYFILGYFNMAVTIGVGSSAFGLIFILACISWKSQIGYELQCRIAGVDFNDYCTCKFHRNLKEEKEKGQSKLE